MISAENYIPLFYIIVTITTLIVVREYYDNNCFDIKKQSFNRVALYLAIFFSLFIGLRPINIVFVDMVSYAAQYDWLQSYKVDYSWDTDNWLFDNLIIFSSKNGYTKQLFFCCIATIYYFISYLAIKRIFNKNTLAAYLIWLGAFSTFSFGVNGLKAGAASAFFLLAIAFYDKRLYALLFSIISLGFHHSMIVCIIAYFLVYVFKNTKYYLYFWILCFIIAALHITYFQNLFGNYTDEQGSMYLLTLEGDSFGGRGGFRLDFIIYSIIPIIIGYVAIIKKGLLSVKYSIIYNFYLVTNSIWMLCMYASFTNRIAYLSWFIYPIVLIYPLLEMKWGETKLHIFQYVALGNIGFTLLMTFIY